MKTKVLDRDGLEEAEVVALAEAVALEEVAAGTGIRAAVMAMVPVAETDRDAAMAASDREKGDMADHRATEK